MAIMLELLAYPFLIIFSLISDVNIMGQWIAAQLANKVVFIIATVQLWSSTIKSQKMKRLPNTHMSEVEDLSVVKQLNVLPVRLVLVYKHFNLHLIDYEECHITMTCSMVWHCHAIDYFDMIFLITVI